MPRGYLTGQETALVSALDGKAPKPTLTPPYPFERGLRGRPTLVSNAETYAHIALVARYGATWYRALGTAGAPGTRLVTVSGAVQHTGVMELVGGTTMRRLLDASGGLSEPLQGLLLGGYSGRWLPADAVDLVLDEGALQAHGATLGAGIIFALGQSACAVAEVASAVQWLRRESAGQCGVCSRGLGAISDALLELCSTGDQGGAYAQLERWCALVTGRGACGLPDGAAAFVTSALKTFKVAFDDHARHGRCDACVERRLLPLPPERRLAAA